MSTKTTPEELTEQSYGYGVAIIVAALMIFLAYHVVGTLVGHLPAQVGSILVGLVGVCVSSSTAGSARSFETW